MNINIFKNIVIAILVMTLSGVAYAKPSLQSCAALESAADRLACYDAIAHLERERTADEFAKPRSTEIQKIPEPIVTHQQAKDAIGEERVVIIKAENKEQSKTVEEYARDGIAFTVERSVKDGVRRQVFYMADGQVWRELGQSQLFYPKRQGFDVVIDRGSMGDYRLRVEGKGPRVRVVRLR